jgi:hypothetical protein
MVMEIFASEVLGAKPKLDLVIAQYERTNSTLAQID